MSARRSLSAPLVLIIVASGCSRPAPGPPYQPTLPTAWAPSVTNRYFPLMPGTTWRYTSRTGDGVETIIVEVLPVRRMVNGVVATVVRDRVYLGDELIEDTDDWFAQDSAGNVWYLGEDSKEVEKGKVVGTEGSWEWGVDGALPGIIMWADPAAHIGEPYRQEYLRGEAEDWGKVLSLTEDVTVLSRRITGCIATEDWTVLDGGGREHKAYCPDIGLVLEVGVPKGNRVELTSHTMSERSGGPTNRLPANSTTPALRQPRP